MQKEYTYIAQNENTINEKYLIWHIQGGLGKNIAATGLISSVKQTYSDRKLIMVVSYPEVFINHPDIYRVYNIGHSPYFYQNYIENKDVLIFRHEPYHQTGHITMKKHLIENWCDLLDIPYTKQKPTIYVNYAQRISTDMWKRNKPILVLQTCGGPFGENKHPYAWTRDMPIELANMIVEKLKKEYHIMHVTRKGGYELEGVERIDYQMNNMELFSLLVASDRRILIDSCLQHAAAAFGLPSIVFWIGTSPVVFGYDIHTNIKAKLPKRANQMIGSYLFDFQFDNNQHECPYLHINDMFDINEIDKQLN
jgi:hypothetical protein